jgi:tRNA modification GTPase TrmE
LEARKIFEDTIAAISTPVGTGAIGIVRMSGKDSLKILKNIFKCNCHEVLSHHIYHGFIINSKNEIVDEVLVNIMLAPKTYTREDVVEINCHGGLLCIDQVLQTVLENGARLAEPGEFTKRAYLNGRIDLLQAEAVIDIINSKTNLAKQIAFNQLNGSLSQKINECMQQILDIIAQIEAAIDYPEEYEILNMKEKIEVAMQKVKKLIDSADTGKIIHDGITIAIIGKPNVGKSSLLNALAEKNSAIVTDTPGTTRDVIHEYINIDGVAAKILDTAGIHHTNDSIENLGIEKAKICADNADVILLVFDASREFDLDDQNLLDAYKKVAQKILFVENKIDLPQKILVPELIREKLISVSAQNNLGLENLRSKIKSLVLGESIFDKNNESFICNMRHKSALLNAYNSLNVALDTINSQMPDDLLSIDLRDAYDFLGAITGQSVSDKIADEIFSKFCVGK